MNISLIIPCYNYENLIINRFEKLKKKLKLTKNNYEIIFINDGSSDKTLNKLNLIKKKNKNVLIINSKINIGKSYSLIKGISKSKFDNIVIYDCDLPYFNYFNKVIKLINKYDFIYINRKSKESKLDKKSFTMYQLTRFIIGRLMCLILSYLCLNINVGDTQAGLKAFKKPKNFKKIEFISKKFFFDAEIMILFYSLKKSMKYIPVKYSVPKDSTIKIFEIKNFLYIYEMIKVILFYKFTNLKKYGRFF